jgi:hypothetical protein
MKIKFYNIIKNTLPLLVNSDISFDAYAKDLSSSSKRFLNLSYRHYDNKINCALDFKFPPLESLKSVEDTGIIKLANTRHPFLKIYDNNNNEFIAYNRLSLTKHSLEIGYAQCLAIFKDSYKGNHLFNTFSWFKFIELTMKNNISQMIDLVVDKSLYNYFRIDNDYEYDIETIETSKSYISKRDKSSSGFNNNNSSKFLFLTKTDKVSQKDWIAVVCKCSEKNYIDITNNTNYCYKCKNILSKRYI